MCWTPTGGSSSSPGARRRRGSPFSSSTIPLTAQSQDGWCTNGELRLTYECGSADGGDRGGEKADGGARTMTSGRSARLRRRS